MTPPSSWQLGKTWRVSQAGCRYRFWDCDPPAEGDISLPMYALSLSILSVSVIFVIDIRRVLSGRLSRFLPGGICDFLCEWWRRWWRNCFFFFGASALHVIDHEQVHFIHCSVFWWSDKKKQAWVLSSWFPSTLVAYRKFRASSTVFLTHDVSSTGTDSLFILLCTNNMIFAWNCIRNFFIGVKLNLTQ